MKKLAVVRLVVAATLFAGWIGWLVYLAATQRNPVVLSRPQLLISDLDVIAQVDDPKEKVVVKEVYAWRQNGDPPTVGTALEIANLDKCRRFPRDNEKADAVPPDWQGPGLYILPLRKVDEHYEVALIPPSPGFSPALIPGPPRIYPLTDETRAQLKAIKEPGAATP